MSQQAVEERIQNRILFQNTMSSSVGLSELHVGYSACMRV